MNAAAEAGAAGRSQGSQTPEEIEARLRAQREALSASVDELAARVDPRVQARAAGEQLKDRAETTAADLREKAETTAADLREKAETTAADLRERLDELRERAKSTVERAQDGDSEAIRTVVAVSGGVLAAGLLLGRLLRR